MIYGQWPLSLKIELNPSPMSHLIIHPNPPSNECKYVVMQKHAVVVKNYTLIRRGSMCKWSDNFLVSRRNSHVLCPGVFTCSPYPHRYFPLPVPRVMYDKYSHLVYTTITIHSGYELHFPKSPY